MTASLLLEEALKLPPEERQDLCEKLWFTLDDETARSGTLKAEMQRRIQHAMEHPEEGQTLEEWRQEIFATRGLKL